MLPRWRMSMNQSMNQRKIKILSKIVGKLQIILRLFILCYANHRFFNFISNQLLLHTRLIGY